MLFSTNELFTSCLITTSTKEEKPINVLLDNSDTEDNISKEDNINDKGTEKEDSLDVPEIDKSNIKINLEEKLSNDGLEEIDLDKAIEILRVKGISKAGVSAG